MITTLDQFFNALANNSSRLVIDKASIANSAVGQFHSLFRATGQPAQGVIPTTTAVCASGLLGTFSFTQQTLPVTSYTGFFEFLSSNASQTVEIHDRLTHMGGLSGVLATAQTVSMDLNSLLATSNLTKRIGDSNYSDVQWWLEFYTDTGATAVTATINCTYNDGTTGNLSGTVALAATRRASQMIPLNSLAPAGKFIRGVNTVQLSATTGTAGNFGVTATRLRSSVYCPIANAKFSADWTTLPVGEVPNSSALFLVIIPSTTTTGTLRGAGKLPHG